MWCLTGSRHCTRCPRRAEVSQPVLLLGFVARGCLFAATAGQAWSGDLPYQLQQVLFDTADSITF
jgi:hypothetical protein